MLSGGDTLLRAQPGAATLQGLTAWGGQWRGQETGLGGCEEERLRARLISFFGADILGFPEGSFLRRPAVVGVRGPDARV